MKLRDLKIGIRLTVGFLLITICTGIVGVVGIFSITRGDTSNEILYEKGTVPLGDMALIGTYMQQTRATILRAAMLVKLDTNYDAAYDAMVKIDPWKNEVIIPAVEKYGNTLLSDSAKVAFADLKNLISTYYEQVDTIETALLIDKNPDRAWTVIKSKKYQGTMDNITATLEQMVTLKINAEKTVYLKHCISARNTKIFMITVTIIAILLSIVLGELLTQGITVPIKHCVTVARTMAKGDTDIELVVDRHDEIGILLGEMKEMVSATNRATSIVESLAVGDISVDIPLRSDSDFLLIAMEHLASTSNHVVEVIEKIAVGDLSVEITPRSDNDRLLIAMKQLVNATRDVVSTTERVAAGDLSVEITPRSDNDHLMIAIKHLANAVTHTSIAR